MTNPVQSSPDPDGGDSTVWSPPVQPPPKGPRLRFLRDRLSIALVIAIVLALGVATLLGGELYLRHRANSAVAKVVECEVRDRASVSFGTRPLLLQVMAGTFSDVSIQTAGNQIREAKGMKVDLQIDDLRLQKTAHSWGTMGSLDADITWSSNGIKQSLQDAFPLFGQMVADVTTNPSEGTIELHGGLGGITARPQIAHGVPTLEVVELTGLSSGIPLQTVQPALDAFTSPATTNLPMGIHADSVQVTNSGVTSHFSTRDATIPLDGHDPCLTGM